MDAREEILLSGHSDRFKQLALFFEERFKFIRENKYPLVLPSDPPARFVMHFVPDMFHDIFLDLKNLEHPENHFVPLGEVPETILYDYNYDGILFLSSIHEKHAYTQVFRDGRVETVVAVAKGGTGKENVLPVLKLQKNIVSCLKNHLAVLKKFSLPGPYHLYFRLLAVENIRIDPKDIMASGYDGKGRNKALIKNELVFPRYRLKGDSNIKDCLLPFFDIIWNTFGFRGAPIN